MMKRITGILILLVIFAGFAQDARIAYTGFPADERRVSLDLLIQPNPQVAHGAVDINSGSISIRSNPFDIARGGIGSNSSQAASSSSSMVGSEGDFEMIGFVESLTADTIVVSGTAIAITSSTEIYDLVNVGDRVKLEVSAADGDNLIAYRIELHFNAEEKDYNDLYDGYDDSIDEHHELR